MLLGTHRPLPGKQSTPTLPEPEHAVNTSVFLSVEEASRIITQRKLGTLATATMIPAPVQVIADNADIADATDVTYTAEHRGRKKK